MNNLQELHALGIVPKDIFQARMASLKQQLEVVEQEIRRQIQESATAEDDI